MAAAEYRPNPCHFNLIVKCGIACLLVLGLLGTTQQTCSPRSNETSLLTLGCVAVDGRSFTNMLVVTTTVRLCVIRSVFALVVLNMGLHT